MPPQSLQPARSGSVEDRCGSWRVTWRPGDFVIHDVGSFTFKKIVLPVEIHADIPHDSGCLALKLEDGFRFAILQGSRLMELQVFKRLVSAEVLTALGQASYCFDCTKEAGRIPRLLSVSECSGCRRPYCRNPFCLRRLDVEDAREGRQECWSCRASAELVGRK